MGCWQTSAIPGIFTHLGRETIGVRAWIKKVFKVPLIILSLALRFGRMFCYRYIVRLLFCVGFIVKQLSARCHRPTQTVCTLRRRPRMPKCFSACRSANLHNKSVLGFSERMAWLRHNMERGIQKGGVLCEPDGEKRWMVLVNQDWFTRLGWFRSLIQEIWWQRRRCRS